MEGVGAVSELAQVGRKFPGSGLHTLFRKSQGDLEVTVGPPLSNLQMLPAVVPGEKQGSAFPHLSFTCANVGIHSVTKCILEGLTPISCS